MDLEDIIARDCMIPGDFIVNKKFYYSVGDYDTDIALYEDWDLKIRLAATQQYYYSWIVGIGYRRHGEGLSAAPHF